LLLEKDGEDLDRSVRREKVLFAVQEERNILYIIKNGSNWIGYILRMNCVLKQFIEEKIDESICQKKTRKKTLAATG
jgi:hypothetical protein